MSPTFAGYSYCWSTRRTWRSFQSSFAVPIDGTLNLQAHVHKISGDSLHKREVLSLVPSTLSAHASFDTVLVSFSLHIETHYTIKPLQCHCYLGFG
jgi:hypothetical protein